jgi:hypothetical protein
MTLADYGDFGAVGAGVLMVVLAIPLAIYGLCCLLIPYYIYRISADSTESLKALRRIELLLKPAPVVKEVSKPVEALSEETVRQPLSKRYKVDAKPEEPGWFKL